jgi:predicted nucleic acid-binding protein
MKRKSVYFDSTIPSYYFDERESLEYPCEITRKWWKEESKNFDIYLSVETIAELNRGNYPGKDKILEFVNRIEQLEPSLEISQIVECYIENTLMPDDERGDAVHLAYSSYYIIDFLLTWNCNHLANANKKQHIKIINTRLGLFTPEIITPLELFTER